MKGGPSLSAHCHCPSEHQIAPSAPNGWRPGVEPARAVPRGSRVPLRPGGASSSQNRPQPSPLSPLSTLIRRRGQQAFFMRGRTLPIWWAKISPSGGACFFFVAKCHMSPEVFINDEMDALSHPPFLSQIKFYGMISRNPSCAFGKRQPMVLES